MEKTDYSFNTRKLSVSYYIALAFVVSLAFWAYHSNVGVSRELVGGNRLYQHIHLQRIESQQVLIEFFRLTRSGQNGFTKRKSAFFRKLELWQNAHAALPEGVPVSRFSCAEELGALLEEVVASSEKVLQSYLKILSLPYHELHGLDPYSPDIHELLKKSNEYALLLEQAVEMLSIEFGKKRKNHFSEEVVLIVLQAGLLFVLGMSVFLPVLKRLRKAHNALLLSEEKYSTLVKNSRDGIAILQDSLLKYVSPALVDLLGTSEEEILESDFLTWIAPSNRAAVKKRYHLRQRGIPAQNLYEVELMKKDGTAFFCEINVNLIVYRNAPADLIVLRDITRRRRDAEKIRENERNLARAYEIAHIGNWYWNFKTRELTWSDEIFRIVDCRPGEFTPTYEKFMEFVHPADRGMVSAKTKKAIADPEFNYDVEHRIVVNGASRFVRQLGEVEFDEEGNPLRMIGTVMDTTVLTEKMNQLKLYEMMIESTADPVYLVDYSDKYRMIYVNHAAVEHYGVPREEILQWQMKDWDPNFSEESFSWLKIEMLANPGMILETEHKTGSGELVPVHVTLNSAIIDGKFYIFGYIKNIKKQKEAEQNLIFAKEEAEKASQSKSEFLANMSHEIRTPLNAILGFTEILSERIEDATGKEFLTSISRSGKILLRLINDILDLSKVEAGKLELEYSDVSVHSVFLDMKQIFSQKIEEKALDFHIFIDESLPRSLLLDEIRLRQILLNLIGNAIKFTEKGAITLKASLLKEYDIDGKRYDLEIEVSDTGIGISDTLRKIIFKAFSQEAGHSAKYGGTGLGLAISKRLVNMMGGDITLQSKINEGSRFIIHLKSIAEGSQVAQSVRVNDKPESILFEPAMVLIVDDVPQNREVVTGFLSSHPIDFIEAENGEAAIGKTRFYRPDLVVMDLKMPVMDGYEAILKIKKDPEMKDIPILVASASGMSGNKKQLEKVTSGFLRKPFSKNEIITEFKKVLKYRKVEQKNPDSNPDVSTAKNLSREECKALSRLLGPVEIERFEKIAKTLEFDEIMEFALFIKETAAAHECHTLVAWAERLEGAASTFHVEAIQSCMRDFSIIIKERSTPLHSNRMA